MGESRVIGSVKGNGGPGSGTIREFRDWRAAAEFSIDRKAISRSTLQVHVPPFNRHRAMTLRAQLCIEIAGGKMSWRFQSAQGIPVDALPKPHASDIDRVDWWRAW
jgi:hypothetical protein